MKRLKNKAAFWVKRIWLSALTRIGINTPTKDLGSPSEDCKTWNIYPSCDDLPYKVFKRCYDKQEFHLLGDAPIEVLEQHWIELFSEFSILSDNEELRTLVEHLCEQAILNSKIGRTAMFIEALEIAYHPFYCEKLKELGYRGKYTPETYISDLENAKGKIRNLRVRKKLVDEFVQNLTSNKESSDTSLDESIVEIEKAFKVPINTETLTTQMFALKLKQLKEYYRRLESQQSEAA